MWRLGWEMCTVKRKWANSSASGAREAMMHERNFGSASSEWECKLFE